MLRYMAVAWEGSNERQIAEADIVVRRISSSLSDMHAVFSAPGLAVFAAGLPMDSARTYELPGKRGIILGKLFSGRSWDEEYLADPILSESESYAILRSGCRRLVSHYWGRYIAFVRDQHRGATWILRDPSGGLPCFVTTHQGLRIFFGWMEDCCALRLCEFSIDWTHVAALATDYPVPGHATGLNEVLELQKGECLHLQDGSRPEAELYWNPVEVSRGRNLVEPAIAVDAARRSLMKCTNAWVACHPRIVLQLSGGLDSAIMLACLRGSDDPPEVVCVNYHDQAQAGDERYYARLAASRAGLSLHEIELDPRAVPADEILNFARMATPTAWAETFYARPGLHELARQSGATAIFHGTFGDSLFFYYQTEAHRLADHLSRRGLFNRETIHIALRAALAERRSLWSVLAEGIRKGIFRIPIDPRTYFGKGRWFVTTEATALARASREIVPPCLRDSPRLTPGKFEQIMGLCIAPYYYSPVWRQGDAEPVALLTMQPLLETFLRIPTDILAAGGESRAVVKQAFCNDLPPEIIRRTKKGVVNNFFAAFLQQNSRFIREMLLDGLLCQNGILDRQKLETFFAAEGYTNTRRAPEIVLYHLTLEAWVQKWSTRNRLKAAA